MIAFSDSAASNVDLTDHTAEELEGTWTHYYYYPWGRVYTLEDLKRWKRKNSAEHARDQRKLFENPFEDFVDTRFANPSSTARLLTGRRTKMGRTRNAVRQLPMLGVA